MPEEDIYVFPEKLTISECKEQCDLVKSQLMNIEKHGIDLSVIKQIDTAGLQLIYCLLGNKKISCRKISTEVETQAEMLGINICT